MSNRPSYLAMRQPLRRLCGPTPRPLRRNYNAQAGSGCSSPASSTRSNDGQESYIYEDKGRTDACLEGFKSLYDSGQLLDVTLQVESQEFKCHRVLLASSSDYFRAMFTDDMLERSKSTIQINGVDALSMEQVLNYLYTGKAEIKLDTVQNILSAANLYQLTNLRDGCARYMSRHLESDNCIGIYFFAKAHQCNSLAKEARSMIENCFDYIHLTSSEFLDLSFQNLLEIMSYDELKVSEEDLFEAMMHWLEHDLENRSQYAYQLCSNLRLLLIDIHYFYDFVKDNAHFKSDPRIQALFDEAIRVKLLRSRWMESDMCMEPRSGTASYCRVCIYISYTDDEKKQVLQLYGPNCDDLRKGDDNILIDLPPDIENPALLVTGSNELYIAGGDAYGRAVYKWVPEEVYFEEICPMPVARKQFSLVQLDKWIYAVGGYNQEGNLNLVHRFNGAENWEPACNLPFALRCCSAISYRGKLLVFGGECEKGGKLFVFGSESEKLHKKIVRGKKEISKHTLCYDPSEEKWSFLADMPDARALAGCMIFRNKIYLIGGFGAVSETWLRDKCPENILNTVVIYDPVNNTWEDGPTLPVPLCAVGAVKYRRTIYILGGEGIDSVSSQVYALNTKTNSWEAQEEIITGVTETTIHSAYTVINIDIDDK